MMDRSVSTLAERQQRLDALRQRLAAANLPALVVSAPANIRYLSGFSGSLAYLLIGADGLAEILGDSRYWVQMEEEAPAFALVRAAQSSDLLGSVPAQLKAHGLGRVGFESEHLTVSMYEHLRTALDGPLALEPTTGLVAELRARKSPHEIELLRKAASISSRAFDRVTQAMRPGLRERDVAFLLEQTFRELGADGPAFEPIVAAGERGALPHARASDRVLTAGDMIVMDFGARVHGYHGDITRTVVLGTPTPEQQRALDAVAGAQAASLQATRPGTPTGEADRIAREHVTAAIGPQATFGHGLGHGIGLEVHERPRIGRGEQTPFQATMVVTNEPGVYIPGWGGVRLEEMLVVTEAGYEVLSTASRQVTVG